MEAWSQKAQGPEGESPATVSRGEGKAAGSRDGDEEKEGLKKSPKQRGGKWESLFREWLPSSTPPGPNHKAARPELSWGLH